MGSELGFKTVKWTVAIALVYDFADLGTGPSDYNEDHEFYAYRLPIIYDPARVLARDPTLRPLSPYLFPRLDGVFRRLENSGRIQAGQQTGLLRLLLSPLRRKSGKRHSVPFSLEGLDRSLEDLRAGVVDLDNAACFDDNQANRFGR